MSNSVASLDREGCLRVLQNLSSDFEECAGYLRNCLQKWEEASEKSSPMQWVTEFITMLNNGQKLCADAIETVNNLKVGVNKYADQMQEFVNSGSGIDA